MNTPTLLQVISVFLMRCAMVAKPSLHSKLNHFEILTPSHMKVRVKRSSSNGQVTSKHVSFFAMGRNFNLDLIPGSPVIAPEDFEVRAVDAKGNVEKVDLDLNAFYAGTMNGNPEAIVDASYVDGVWSAQIQAPEDHYFIEPLSKHDSLGPKDAMVIYRNKDVNLYNISGSGKDFLGCPLQTISFGQEENITFRPENWSRFGDRLPSWGNNNKRTHSQTTNHRRRRASAFPYLYCDILSIVDTYAYRGFGKSSVHKIASTIVYWYQMSNRIFSTTDFGHFYGMKIRLRALKILKDFHPTYNGNTHYNMKSRGKIPDLYAVVLSMSFNTEYRKYCVAHMTSERRPTDTTLGLAVIGNDPYVPGSPDFWTGGICAGARGRSFNVGLSTISYQGSVAPDAVYLVVLTHEIGHSWGARHDNPHIPECSPSGENGGKYLMHSRVNAAKNRNNFKFSPCSRLLINKVLQAKAHRCFYPEKSIIRSFCGNGILEPDEECDEGYGVTGGCCTDKCRLRDGALCSETSSPCCTADCAVAPPTKKCYDINRMDCREQAYCDGKHHATCPLPKSRPNGESCKNFGTCWQGRCLTYCENKARVSDPPVQLEDCSCGGISVNLCTLCCRAQGTKDCKLMYQDSLLDNIPCYYGMCQKGRCISYLFTEIYNIHAQLQAVRTVEQQFWLKHLVFFVIAIFTPMYSVLMLCSCYLDYKDDRKK